MRKKLGSRELKLFESVVVEFMLQELGFHVAHVQPGSYHIYERDPAGDEDLHLGSPGVLYLSISTCSSVRGVKPVFYIGCPFPGHPVFQ